MNTLRIELCNPELISDPQELREALQAANRQIAQLCNQLDRLTRGCHALTSEMAVMCEAYLAGNTVLVVHKIREFSQAHHMNVMKASGSMH